MEDYKKLYEEAVERVKNNPNLVPEEIFPELKESEDERIRKELLLYFNSQDIAHQYVDDNRRKRWIAWLEKQEIKKHDVCDTCDEKASCVNPCPVKLVEQKSNPCENCSIATNNCQKFPCTIRDGEQKPADKDKPKFKVGDKITKKSGKSCPVHSSTDDTICEVAEVHDTCYILNTKEGRIQEPFKWQDYYELVDQASLWSEEDEKNMETIINVLYAGTDLAYEREINWLKSLKNRVQPKQEWSEEKIETCAREAEDNNCIILAKHIRQLKSLSPQNHWKPSDEQMKALRAARATFGVDDVVLASLIYDLEKLKE